jgi:hypothetical protein
MKYPKHRSNLYLVERWTRANSATVLVGAFSSIVAADNFKEECEQEWKDRGLSGEEEVIFNVVLTTYYDT